MRKQIITIVLDILIFRIRVDNISSVTTAAPLLIWINFNPKMDR